MTRRPYRHPRYVSRGWLARVPVARLNVSRVVSLVVVGWLLVMALYASLIFSGV